MVLKTLQRFRVSRASQNAGIHTLKLQASRRQASKQANKPASEQTRKQGNKEASKHASTQSLAITQVEAVQARFKIKSLSP